MFSHALMYAVPNGCQKYMEELVELELQEVVNSISVLGIVPEFFQRAANALNIWLLLGPNFYLTWPPKATVLKCHLQIYI